MRSKDTIRTTYSKDTTSSQRDNCGTVRSTAAMKGLLLAEVGGGMVQLDVGSGFVNGPRITSDAITPGGSLRADAQEAMFQAGNLARHGTLITENASPERTAEELQRLLGNSCAKLKPGRTLLPPPGGNSFEHVQMEQAKPRARVDVDIVLESNIFVQGGIVRGHAVLCVRKPTKKEGPILIFGGKIRIIGFECISGTKLSHSFYQCSSKIFSGKSYFDGCHRSQEFGEDFTEASQGTYHFPFSMRLPTSDKNGCPKGIVYGLAGAEVRYVAVASLKLKDTLTGKRSIAHFYRTCEVWPLLDPERILAPAPRPLRATTSKSLFMGGNGKLTLTASLTRLYWVTGQQCFVHLNIQNETKKAVTSVTVSLLRNTVIFRPLPQLDTVLPGKSRYERDPDACQTSTTTKVIAESVLEAGDRATKGYASAKGWWTGVPPKKKMNFTHSIVIPPSEVSLPRSRLLEVEYVLKVSLCAGTLLSADVQLSLPVRLVNFLSLDPYISSVLNPSSKYEHRSEDASQLDKDSRPSYSEQDEADDLPVEDGLYSGDVSIDETVFDRDSDYDSEELESVFPEDSSMVDEPEELVRRAVISSRVDQMYGGHAPRFADLYYACIQDNQAAREASTTSSTSSSSSIESRETESYGSHFKCRSGPTNGLESNLRASTDIEDNDHSTSTVDVACRGHPNSGQAISSFALRVEDKLRAVQKNASVSSASSTSSSISEAPVDEVSAKMASDQQRTSDTTVPCRLDLSSVDKAAKTASSCDLIIPKNEINRRSGLVKSKIQELEKRFGAAG